MTHEPQDVERRSSWRDEHLDCICGLANGRGGVLEIGRNERGEALGVTEVPRLIEEIPVKVQSVLGLVVNVHLKSDCGRDYLRIDVPSHPTRIRYRRRYPDLAELEADDDRARTDGSASKQPEPPDQPENRQKTTDRILTFLRKNPSAGRREIAKALADATEGSVRYQIDKLKAVGRLRRVGPDRGGHWRVIDESNVEARNQTGGAADERRDAGKAESAISQKTTRKAPGHDRKTARNGHPPESPPLSDRILALLRRDPSASRREIAAALGTTRSTVRYRLDKLRKAGKIERIGPDKGGHWKMLGESAVEPDPTSERDPWSSR